MKIYRSALQEDAVDLRPEIRSDDNLFEIPNLEEIRNTASSKRISGVSTSVGMRFTRLLVIGAAAVALALWATVQVVDTP